MSQDNPVTPLGREQLPAVLWVKRSMSLQSVGLFRLRQIERMFGNVRRSGHRCGCQNDSRYDAPQEAIRLWCGLVADAPREHVRSLTPCRLLSKGWMVWQPETVGFAWAEVLEIENLHRLFEELSAPEPVSARSLGEWEAHAGQDLKFRLYTRSDELDDDGLVRRLRVDVVRDVLQRNQNFSHVNVTVASAQVAQTESQFVGDFRCNGLEAERLRTRLLPSWHCRDMAVHNFTTYTMTRKDT